MPSVIVNAGAWMSVGWDVSVVGCQRGVMSAWRILPSLLQQLVDVVYIVERVVEEEAQLGDDAQLVAHTLAEVIAYRGLVAGDG